jgi:hypothetical protein
MPIEGQRSRCIQRHANIARGRPSSSASFSRLDGTPAITSFIAKLASDTRVGLGAPLNRSLPRAAMAVYHLYKVLDFDRQGRPIEVEADSDAEAIRKSQQYLDGADLLLWQSSRFVITIKHKRD